MSSDDKPPQGPIIPEWLFVVAAVIFFALVALGFWNEAMK